MHRELNPHLFGSASAQNTAPATFSGEYFGPTPGNQAAAPYPPLEFKNLEQKTDLFQTAMKQMEKRTEILAFKMEELARAVHTELKTVSEKIARLEKAQALAAEENANRVRKIAMKFSEQGDADFKIQELLDRHNTIVRNFENRMTNMQRIISEQEIMLNNTREMLKR